MFRIIIFIIQLKFNSFIFQKVCFSVFLYWIYLITIPYILFIACRNIIHHKISIINPLSIIENGIVEQIDNILSIRGPAINLDERGFFKKPKLIESYKINENNDYNNSLEKSITFFLNKVKKKEFFNKKLFNCALKSNSLIL